VTLPKAPEGYEYKLVSTNKKPRIKDKDPSELTPRQLSGVKYREKNKDKILEEKRQKYQEKKKQKVSEPGTTPS